MLRVRVLGLASLLAAAHCGAASPPDPFADPPPVSAPSWQRPGSAFVIAAAGDVAGRMQAQAETAALLLRLNQSHPLAAILLLGDSQYPGGAYHDYLADYDPSWGVPALRALTRPVPGNHEYDEGHSLAEGYFDYFNGRGQAVGPAGRRGQGYYSFDMGDWHFVALNTSDGCHAVACDPDSPMLKWLRRDLAAASQRCVLAYFHQPRFQTGEAHADGPEVDSLWLALVEAHVDLALSGHDHNFQQLAPLDREGRLDRAGGMRSFVVGTGGARLYTRFDDIQHADAMEQRQARYHGVLELTLAPASYSWRFVTTTGVVVVPGGQDRCR